MPSPLAQLFETESTIDADFHTRIPEAARQALGLKPGDRLRFRIEKDGRVLLENLSRPATARRAELPPLVGMVAGLLSAESCGPAAAIEALDPGLATSLQALIGSAAAPSVDQSKQR